MGQGRDNPTTTRPTRRPAVRRPGARRRAVPDGWLLLPEYLFAYPRGASQNTPGNGDMPKETAVPLRA